LFGLPRVELDGSGIFSKLKRQLLLEGIELACRGACIDELTKVEAELGLLVRALY